MRWIAECRDCPDYYHPLSWEIGMEWMEWHEAMHDRHCCRLGAVPSLPDVSPPGGDGGDTSAPQP